jgi:hypothetical protein
MGTVFQHLLGDAASDVADGLIGGFPRFQPKPVMKVCRLSCQRPFTFAPAFAVFHEVLKVTIGLVGSSIIHQRLE